jgi:hypothetical protein
VADMASVIPLFGAFIHEAQMRATDAVLDEDRSNDLHETLTNGAIRGEPPLPTAQDISQAYLDQAMQIENFLRSRQVAPPGAT